MCEDVQFASEDSSRSDLEYLCDVLAAAVDTGARTLNVTDTVECAIPAEWGERIRTIRARLPGADRVMLSVHCHDDLGLATANSLAAIANGARQVECTINGIGERAGNASLEEVVMALRTRRDVFGLETGIRTEELYRTSRLLSQITGVPVPPNKAVVGDNAFSHESGIHQDGVLKEKLTYEIMRPEDVGWGHSRMVLGKHSGRHALAVRLSALGVDVAGAELDEAFRRFKTLADGKKEVDDGDLLDVAKGLGHTVGHG